MKDMSEEFNQQEKKCNSLARKCEKLRTLVEENNKYKAAYEKMEKYFELVEN